jgi:hypothetical protein
MDGKMLTSLVNKKQSSGLHEFIFDGNGYPSGIYFYNLEAGGIDYGFKKMILIK